MIVFQYRLRIGGSEVGSSQLTGPRAWPLTPISSLSRVKVKYESEGISPRRLFKFRSFFLILTLQNKDLTFLWSSENTVFVLQTLFLRPFFKFFPFPQYFMWNRTVKAAYSVQSQTLLTSVSWFLIYVSFSSLSSFECCDLEYLGFSTVFWICSSFGRDTALPRVKLSWHQMRLRGLRSPIPTRLQTAAAIKDKPCFGVFALEKSEKQNSAWTCCPALNRPGCFYPLQSLNKTQTLTFLFYGSISQNSTRRYAVSCVC